MGLNKRFLHKTFFVDTAPFIYFIEKNKKYHKKLFEIFQLNDTGYINFQTSTLTLLEVLVQPLKFDQLKLAAQYEQILTTSPNLAIYTVDVTISKRAAELRAYYNLKTPDAIQLATALEKKADIFFTNDLDLKKISEIEILTIEDI